VREDAEISEVLWRGGLGKTMREAGSKLSTTVSNSERGRGWLVT
jgi:hypothetical protein